MPGSFTHVLVISRDQALIDKISQALTMYAQHYLYLPALMISSSEKDLANAVYHPLPEMVFVDQALSHKVVKLLRNVRQQWANTQIILVAPTIDSAMKLLKHKVTAILMPTDTIDEYYDTILRTLRLRVYLSQVMAALVLQHFPVECEHLEPIESQIFHEILAGDAYTKIAITHKFHEPQVIEKHLYNLISRLWESPQ